MGSDNNTNDGTEKRFDINAQATPEEIIAAWKAQKLAEGSDLNDAFVEQFKSRR